MFKPSHFFIACVCAAAIAACGPEDSTEPGAVDYPVLEGRVWAGEKVVVRSPDLRVDGTQITSETGTLEATVDGDSAEVLIPETFAGPLTLRLTTGGRRVVARLDVAGFLGSNTVTTPLGWYLLGWPREGRASVVGGDGTHIYQLLPDIGYVRTLVEGFSAGQDVPRVPGPTYVPGLMVIQPDRGGNAQLWQLLPQPHFVDSLPMPNTRHLALLNDSTVVRAFHHEVQVWRIGDSTRVIYRAPYEETHEIFLSPAANRATLRVNGSPTGPPVFDMTTGDTAYHVRALFRSYGAAFSENGDTLWMAGTDRSRDPTIENDYPSRLLLLDARSGVIRRSRGFDHMLVEFVLKDPNASRLYLMARTYGRPADAVPDLLILDSETLDDVGHARAPSSIRCGSYCDYSILVMGTDGVFVVNGSASFKFGSMLK